VDLYEKALMKRNGNRLPKQLEAKLVQLSKMATARQREREGQSNYSLFTAISRSISVTWSRVKRPMVRAFPFSTTSS
jgi:hypothetical protein